MGTNKYIRSETTELKRSQIKPASYNPRTITLEGRKQLKRSIKRYGVVGGIVVNKQSDYTIVAGHQKVAVLDELNKYDDATFENDYTIRAEVVDVDEKTEKELNVTLNNPNVGGQFDFDKLSVLIPEIDYKEAGLTEADLNLIGLDFLFQTEGERELAEEIEDMMQPQKEKDKSEKKAHMKEVKAEVTEKARDEAENMCAYLTLSFDNFERKAEFCERFGINPYDKFYKGETFADMCEVVID